MIEAHLLKLRRRADISAADEAAIRACIGEVRDVPAGRTVIRANTALNESILLLDGWLARTRDLSGGQRQITELHVSGDFADMHAFTLKRLDHDIVTLSRVKLAIFPHDRLRGLFEAHPHLARVYWFGTNLDAAIHREWTVSLGRRQALARIAHLFCELHVRLSIIGQTNGDSYHFPLTQEELAECVGLTAVHVNRTLQELRAQKLILLENREVTLLDHERLKQVADFTPSYLYLENAPR